jgi:hypothetical protein
MQGRQMINSHLSAFLKSIYQIKAFELSNPTLHQATNFIGLLVVIRSGKPLLISLYSYKIVAPLGYATSPLQKSKSRFRVSIYDFKRY